MLDETAGGAGGAFDAARYRQVLGHFCSGVTVVTSLDEGDPVGFTAQAFTSVSLEPPLVLVCPSVGSQTWPRIAGSGAFCANVLAEDQEALGRLFATRGVDRFRGVGWQPAPATGSPVLAGVLAWVDCTLEETYEVGDHFVAIGRVLELGVGEDTGPLLFYRGGYGRLVR